MDPDMKCKSRKRKKTRAAPPKPKEKLFCPRTMVRYDNSHSDYPTKFVCKMCLKVLLSENAVKNHLITCIPHSRPPPPAPPKIEEPPKENPYICKYCDKVFSRAVTLKRHLEDHEKTSELSDNETDHYNKLKNMKQEKKY